MSEIRTIEPRKATSEPLVEIAIRADGLDGPFVPARRRERPAPALDGEGNALPYPDGLNSYGLTEVENVAFQSACDRLAGRPEQSYSDPDLDAAMATEGLSSTSAVKKREAFVARYRKDHPLPTSFRELAAGDPSSNYAAQPDSSEVHSDVQEQAGELRSDPARPETSAPAPEQEKPVAPKIVGVIVDENPVADPKETFRRPTIVSVGEQEDSHVIAPTATHVAVEKADVQWLRRTLQVIKRDTVTVEHFAVEELRVIVEKFEALL